MGEVLRVASLLPFCRSDGGERSFHIWSGTVPFVQPSYVLRHTHVAILRRPSSPPTDYAIWIGRQLLAWILVRPHCYGSSCSKFVQFFSPHSLISISQKLSQDWKQASPPSLFSESYRWRRIQSSKFVKDCYGSAEPFWLHCKQSKCDCWLAHFLRPYILNEQLIIPKYFNQFFSILLIKFFV